MIMGSTLEHGIYLPSEGEKNCYSGLANNWQTVDTNIGYVTSLRQAIAGALTRQIVTQLPTENIDPNCIYMILKATAQTSNIYDEYMYINSNWELIGDSQLDLSNYYTKQEVNELPAVASGVTSTKVGNYDTHIADNNIHVTVADKSKWDTVALIKQLRLVNTQVGSATTIPFSDFDDTNGIKVGDKCMDLDGKLFEITAVDTANETVSVTTPLTQLAVDSSVIHKTGNETKSGELTLNDTLNVSNVIPNSNNSYDFGSVSNLFKNLYAYHGYFRGNQQGDEYSSNTRTNLTLLSNRDTLDESGILFDTYRQNTAQGTGIHILGISIKENSVRYEGCRFGWYWDNSLNGYYLDFKPTTQGTHQAVKHNLGTSTDKWDTINGINPGALSLPDLSNGLDISSYLDTSQSSRNYYTPTVDGWISVKGRSSSGTIGLAIIQGDFAQMGYNIYDFDNNRVGFCALPVKAGVQVEIWLKTVTMIDSAKFFPCLGNV